MIAFEKCEGKRKIERLWGVDYLSDVLLPDNEQLAAIPVLDCILNGAEVFLQL